jgi:dTDP-4-amino-4,6-dideoxygalactose transaminase
VSVSPEIKFLDLEAQRQRLEPGLSKRIKKVLDEGNFILGSEVVELEQELAARAGVSEAITCGNGTDALQLVLMAWGVGPGDAVFVPSFTFTSTAEVVSLLGATPVFCDIDPKTYNLDPHSLQSAIDMVLSEGDLAPKALVPVDLFGLPADHPVIGAIAKQHKLKVLVDAAQSFGAELNGKSVGWFGDATATSFFPSKPLGCYGDGGAIFTNDADLSDRVKSLRVHGKGATKYETINIGLNSRLDTLQAAILLAKLEIFDEEISLRQQVAARYTRNLEALPQITTPIKSPSAWAQFTIRTADRERLARDLKEVGIPTMVYYPRPLHEQDVYTKGHAASRTAPDECKEASQASQTVLSLPMHPYLTSRQIDEISKRVANIV